VQKSVFECRLTKSRLKKLLEELRKITIETGFIRIYKVYSASKPIDIGCKQAPDFDDGPAFIV